MQGKQYECVAEVEEGLSVLVFISAHEFFHFPLGCGQNNEWLGQGKMARQVSRLLVSWGFFMLTHARIKQC